mmetsp:Transcript_2638/g.4016  ORF Transcript_2638/g.4016 Transcript_2638/m.4016 type:complete len:154 (-) Transcript_2638:237-698(-)
MVHMEGTTATRCTSSTGVIAPKISPALEGAIKLFQQGDRNLAEEEIMRAIESGSISQIELAQLKGQLSESIKKRDRQIECAENIREHVLQSSRNLQTKMLEDGLTRGEVDVILKDPQKMDEWLKGYVTRKTKESSKAKFGLQEEAVKQRDGFV